MDTLIYGVLTFLLVLGPLIILHELGHLFVARKFGVKVLEFGFGFPPRAAGLWTGKTVVHLDRETRFEYEPVAEYAATTEAAAGALGLTGPAVGDIVTVRALRGENGDLKAITVRPKEADDEGERAARGELFIGKVRRIDGDQIVLADMLWSFNWLPLGGFVRMVGEEDPDAPGSLASKSRFARISVMAAGAAVNFAIPFLLFPLVLMIPRSVDVGEVVISSVFPNSPAAAAGVRRGDKVIKVDGRQIETIGELQNAVTLKLGGVSTWEVQRGIPDPFAPAGSQSVYQYTGEVELIDVGPRWKPPLRTIVDQVTDSESEIGIRQARIFLPFAGVNNSLLVVADPVDTLTQISLSDARRYSADIEIGDTLSVIPIAREGVVGIPFAAARERNELLGVTTTIQEGAVGVQIGVQSVRTESRGLAPWEAIPDGVQQAVDVILLTRNAIQGLAIGSTNPQFSGPATVGPIGIGQITGEIATADASFADKVITLASLSAIISFSLAVINILPIPALDGGRILFVLIEIARRGKRVPPEREGLVHLGGMIVLLGLIALITVGDITRIFRGDSIIPG
jgi:regulator of sigma E protease